MAAEPSSDPRRISQIYRPNGEDNEIVVYAGDLDVDANGTRAIAQGQLELRLFPQASFVARFSGPPSKVGPHLVFDHDATVSVPQGRPLTPPTRSSLPTKPEKGSWIQANVRVSHLDAGDLRSAVRFVVHVSRSVQMPEGLVPLRLPDGTRQGQIPFQLPDWSLVLAPVEGSSNDADFGAVVEAIPTSLPIDSSAVDELCRRLYLLLGFVSSGEVGIAAVCGLDDEAEIVWASWVSPRLQSQKGTASWCTGQLVAPALPVVADGFVRVARDRSVEAIVDRAINHLLAADAPGVVLDLRVPIACSGLEVLSWAVLRRNGWVSQGTFRQMTAAAALRLLAAWADIDADLPDSLPALIARRGRLGQRDLGGPELLYEVRNAVVHPPKSIDDPEWPSTEELFECWQLSTWYLQLALLRLLDYDGAYWSRLRLGRSVLDVEPVPWARADD